MSSRLAESERLHARARARVVAWEKGEPPPESFDSLAVALARFQADTIPGVARLFAARGIDPRTLASAIGIPAVPTDAFKMTDVCAFAAEDAVHVFRTSGTTIGARGTHRMRDVGTYDRGACAFGRFGLARDLEGRLPILVLGPSPEEANDSSLTHMIGLFVREFGEPEPTVRTYFLREGELDVAGFAARAVATGNRPSLVLGTSFAFVHFLDALAAAGNPGVPLGKGSRVMQTGGYKGRSREVPAAELRRGLARTFQIPSRAIVSEYGMTELSSQFYEGALFGPVGEGVYVEPPWASVTPVDPETLEPVAPGELGIARVTDLLNVDSAVVIQTEDLVRRVDGGFTLHGRRPGAASRGCSIAIDELLGA